MGLFSGDQIESLPWGKLTGVPAGITNPTRNVEPKIITADNTIPALINTPIDADKVLLVVRGQLLDPTGASPPFSVNAATKAITWNAPNAYTLKAGWKVTAIYDS